MLAKRGQHEQALQIALDLYAQETSRASGEGCEPTHWLSYRAGRTGLRPLRFWMQAFKPLQWRSIRLTAQPLILFSFGV